ncbi:MAG: virulence factor SrfB [Desulfovibrio sp.]|nr:virulence factor SrfB [Desulfovibrio sp.]
MHHMPEYKDTISLIPYGLPQFLDFEIAASQLKAISRSFWEESLPDADEGHKARLHIMKKDENGDDVDSETGKRVNGPQYTVNAQRDLAVWYGEWLPMPYLRRTAYLDKDDGLPIFEAGPANWARARIVPSPDSPDEKFRIVIAFDMQTEDAPEQGGKSYALSEEDVAASAVFSLAWRARDNAWFINEGWIDRWLKDTWDAFYAQNKLRSDFADSSLVYLATYLVLLEAIHQATAIETSRSDDSRCVQIINPASQSQPVDVDLILDIGNSRTTGMLVETRVQKSTDLNDSYLLQLRDMDRPENIYTEPFETRVEFSEADFGNEAYSRRSGRRTPAFSLVSAVRTGREAARLASQSACAEGTTGMSSPKRYLWDERDWQPTWRYNARKKGDRELMVTTGALPALLNDSGTPLCCMDDRRFSANAILRRQEREIAFESKFSRSSLMMFLFIELLQQALMTVNSPAQRSRRELPDVPRHLRRVVFTVPAGMPVAEQRIYKRWAEWAVKTLWEGLGWKNFDAARARLDCGMRDHRMSPEVWCRWDEATCTQLVYIYNEIMRNFQGDAHMFFRHTGKTLARYGGKPCLRVATIDMGGGTTDLSITTFVLENDRTSTTRVAPHQEIRDGFNIAGDDVLKNIVRDVVFKSLAVSLENSGVRDAPALLHELFGKNMMNSSIKEQNLRTQFIRQVGIPAALTVLSHYEQQDLHKTGGNIAFRLGQVFDTPGQAAPDGWPCGLFPAPHERVLEYVRKAIKDRRGVDFPLREAPIDVSCGDVDSAIDGSVRDVLRNMCELTYRYGCDVLLLTGRPSCWNAVVRDIFACLPVAPDRVTPMRTYKVGPWYPFADSFGNIVDPKTTVIAGAILCALAENSMEGFAFDATALKLSSTARYIGELDTTGQLSRDKVWFTVDIDKKQEAVYERKGDGAVEFSAPIVLGFRQLEAERWTATRFYRMEFATEEAARRAQGKTPYHIDLSLSVSEIEDDAGTDQIRDEGEFQIEEIRDRLGEGVSSNDIVILLRTLKKEEDEGCWLDTGILY